MPLKALTDLRSSAGALQLRIRAYDRQPRSTQSYVDDDDVPTPTLLRGHPQLT